jgi:hypothetical protein
MKDRDSTARRSLKVMAAYVAVAVLCIAAVLVARSHLVAPHRERNAALNAIASNLRILEGAKEIYALEYKLATSSPVVEADLLAYLHGNVAIQPVAGEIYTINPVGELIAAKLTRKLYQYDAGQLLTVTNF